MSSLSHSMIVRSSIARVLDRAQLVQPAAGDDEAAHMLGQVAGKADDLGDQVDGLGQPPVGGVEAHLAHPLRVGALAGHAPDLAGQPGGDVLGQAHHLAHLADRGAGAEMDHRRTKAGAVAAVFGIDVLDHLFAPFMFEIDVDTPAARPGISIRSVRRPW